MNVYSLRESSFTEKEAGDFNLHVSKKMSPIVRPQVGFEVFKIFESEKSRFIPSASLEADAVMQLGSRDYLASFTSLGSQFQTRTYKKNWVVAVPKLSVTYQTQAGVYVTLAYIGQVSNLYKSHAIDGRVNWRF
jgi:hypothetical protein